MIDVRVVWATEKGVETKDIKIESAPSLGHVIELSEGKFLVFRVFHREVKPQETNFSPSTTIVVEFIPEEMTENLLG